VRVNEPLGAQSGQRYLVCINQCNYLGAMSFCQLVTLSTIGLWYKLIMTVNDNHK